MYYTLFHGTTGDTLRDWDTKEQAESAAKNAKLLGYDCEVLTAEEAEKIRQEWEA